MLMSQRDIARAVTMVLTGKEKFSNIMVIVTLLAAVTSFPALPY